MVRKQKKVSRDSSPVGLVKAHLDSLEQELLVQSPKALTARHMGNRGKAREDFINRFLEKHIGQDLAIANGEIFDAETKVGSEANEIDIIIYDRRYPKLSVSDRVSAIMVDAVHATIEVKSKLTKRKLLGALDVISALSELKCIASAPKPWPFYYVVAYSCDTTIDTVFDWVCKSNIGNLAGICICILGKGLIASNWPAVQIQTVQQQRQSKINNGEWLIHEGKSGNLYTLFYFLNVQRISELAQYFPDRLLPDFRYRKPLRTHKS